MIEPTAILRPVALALLVLLPVACAAAPSGLVTRDGARLMLDGKEYRAIGVNVPNLHQAYLGTWFHIAQKYGTPAQAKQAMVDAIEDAEKSNLKFIRFFTDPGYPRDRAMLYDKDPEAYWRGMDELFALCRQHHLKLVPSLNCLQGPFQSFDETGQAILDPQSKTYAWAQRYVREFVTRYKDDPTVLMWELGNEGMLRADVEMQGRQLLPKGVFPEGANPRVEGNNGDSLSFAMLQRIYREQATFIKSLDPNHLVTSGDGAVREECTSRRETFPNFKFRSDTWREWVVNNLASQPEPLDVYSFHFYGNDQVGPATKPWAGMTPLEWMRRLVRAALATNEPVFIGELGTDPNNRADPQSAWLRQCIAAMDQEGVSLMALWVWHFNWQPEFTLDSTNAPDLVRCAAEFNRKYAP